MTSRVAESPLAQSFVGNAVTNQMDGRTTKHVSRIATTEYLVEYTHRTLQENAEKQRPHANGAESFQPALPPPDTTLDLSNKSIRELPIEVIEIIRDKVERLALSHNPSLVIPQSIAQCSRLFYLNLRWNDFTTFPEAILRLTGLHTLDLSRNRITTIPDGITNMTSLKTLAFTHNKVTRLPLCLGDMPSLTKLRLDDNPISFPPPEEYTPSEHIQKRPGFEPNHYVCAQVKRFLRSTSMRERQKQESESDMNESNLETPRPSRRQLVGRFPVRPSKTSFESMDPFDPRSMPPPPIPQRSVARDSLTIPPIRRPGLAPLRIDAMSHRSKSENLQAGHPKVRRIGYVHRKVSGPPSANAVPKDFGTLKPNHFRNASSSQLTVNDPNGAGYMSSETVSPVEGPVSRPWMAKSRLSSLPEDRRISKLTSPTIRSARLVVYSLDQLQRPVDDAIRIIKACSPKGYTTAKYYAAATNSVRGLDAQLHILTPLEEDNTKETSKEVRAILRKTRECLNHYCLLMTELRLHARKMVKGGEPMYLRALMMQMYTCLVEVRNACTIQESALSTPVKIIRSSQAVSDRTVTPTQPKPTGKRARGAKIIAGWRDRSPGYSVSMLSASSSRTNTMTSVTAATPRSGESFRGAPLIRSNTYQSYGTDSEEERQFERIYLSLRTTSDLADQTLPNCRMDFFVRKEGAARSMQGAAARAWTVALTKCDALINALEKLKKSLQKVKINDPALRATREFWHICDGFVRAWYDLASEMKNLGNQGLDIGAIKVLMRPVQKAVKDLGHVLTQSPMYKGSLKPQSTLNPLPPTPLSAALGPAAQATVPNTPGGLSSPAEYFFSHGHVKERDRSDTVTSRYGKGVPRY